MFFSTFLLSIRSLTSTFLKQIFGIEKLYYFYRPNSRFMTKTREHILRVSLKLFLQKSYKEVTMKEIVEKTSLSKGAFYHYFRSKEELFKEIIMMFFSYGSLNYETFPKTTLKAFLETYIKRIGESFHQINLLLGGSPEQDISFNFFYIMFDGMKRFPEIMDLEQKQYLSDRAVWESIINIAKSSGEIATNSSSKELADLFLYATDGVFIRVLNSVEQIKYSVKLEEAFFSIYENLKT